MTNISAKQRPERQRSPKNSSKQTQNNWDKAFSFSNTAISFLVRGSCSTKIGGLVSAVHHTLEHKKEEGNCCGFDVFHFFLYSRTPTMATAIITAIAEPTMVIV
jgi:hypothetical protein